MDLRSLMNKLDTIAEAGGRAEYDKFKAQDARNAAIQAVKQMTKPNGNNNFIDPKDGIIKYQEAGPMGTSGSIKEFPYSWFEKGQEKGFFDQLKTAGLEVIPVEKKSLFSTYQVAGVDLQKFANLEQAAAQSDANAETAAQVLEQLKQLMALIDQYIALKAKKKAAQATPAPAQGATATPVTAPKPGATAGQAAGAAIKKEGIQFNSSIAQNLVESFGYELNEAPATLAQQAAVGAGTYGATKAAGKMLGKAIPGVGLAFGAADAYSRAKEGDYLGAGLAGLSGLTSLVPGIGTAASLGLDAVNLGRDYAKGQAGDAGAVGALKNAPGAPKQGASGADPKVQALQQKLIAAGAKIKADGIMGPATQAAMKQFPNVKEGIEMNKPQSVADQIASLRTKLDMLEAQSTDQEITTDEPVEETLEPLFYETQDGAMIALLPDGRLVNEAGEQLDGNTLEVIGEAGLDEGTLSNIWSGTKNLYRGLQGQGARTAAGKFMKAGASTPNKVGKALRANPVKTALGAATLGGATGYAMGKDGGGQGPSPTPVKPPKPGPAPAPAPDAPVAPVAPDAGGEDDELKALRAQIEKIMSDLAQNPDPAVQKGLVDARAKWSQATGDKNIGSADQNGLAKNAPGVSPEVAKAQGNASNATANTTGGPNMGQVNK